jgi:hypothetical protein
MSDISKGVELIFTDAVDNLRFLKQQQWAVVRYALAAYAALFAVAAALEIKGDHKFFFFTAVVIVLAFSLLILASLREAFDKFRKRIEWIYANRLQSEQAEGLPLKHDKPYFDTAGFILYLALVSIALVPC